jgi:hypothetical protein
MPREGSPLTMFALFLIILTFRNGGGGALGGAMGGKANNHFTVAHGA